MLHYLFVTPLLCSRLQRPPCLFVASLFLQGFHCFIICLLRHCSVLGFNCFIFWLLCHYPSYFLKFSIFHCCIICLLLVRTALFSASIVPSSVSSVCYVTTCILFLQCFHCSVICLL